ncbi:MAG: PAS domain S-box protein, partial [Betaproteobacteria bacterium]|nr:PAS domain S-box protein [Betaproteobacteria bacterium]
TPEGRFLQVNRALCEITGYSGEELLRLTFQQITHPEDLPANLDNLRRVLSCERYAFQMEKRYLHKDGGIVWIKIAVTTVRGDDGRPLYVIAQIENINDRKRAEAALRQSEEQFRQLATNIPQVFWICDAAQREAIYVSPAYENITGRTQRAVTVKPRAWLHAVHADDRRRVLAARKGALDGDYDEEYRIVQPDGSIRWVHDRAFPVHDADGRAYRIAGIAEDVTERKQAEERLMYLAHYDGLTSLPNRILFYDRLKQALAQAKRNQWTLGVMFIDLDHGGQAAATGLGAGCAVRARRLA